MSIADAKRRLADASFQHLICRETSGCSLSTSKVLNALMDCAVKEEGRCAIAQEICDVIDDTLDTEAAAKALVDLANSWIEHFLFPVFILNSKEKGLSISSGSQTPTLSLQETERLIECATRGDRKALYALLRRREGDRCCITNAPNIQNLAIHCDDLLPVDLEVAHIIPCSFHDNLIEDEDICEGKYTSVTPTTWEMLRIWSSVDFKSWVKDNIHGPGNAILLSMQFRMNFDAFRFWLEKDTLPDTYKVQVDPRLTPLVVKYRNKVINFVDHSAPVSASSDAPRSSIIPPPQPIALSLHASFAKLLHASGANEFFDHVLNDETHGWKGMKTLAEGGSTDLSLMMP
ncbi:hypothetical protein M413DRAFT_439049 [Hebeloma cylindrosporum]|uniref:HNH nuclease domain-containing protein n=1 Tax=Hebeloma cylindrosporum TaxID=76867 RepID=A0A0C3D1A7_HEBCY|nr:hypothetical protein M413DRAFT_439049 [Hebeloma cylindrosporum h7]